MLACCGHLNPKPFGPPVVPPLSQEELTGLFDAKEKWPVTKDPAEHTRRSVYLLVRRTFLYPMFAAFDPPEVDDQLPAADADGRADAGAGPAEQPAGARAGRRLRPTARPGTAGTTGRRHRSRPGCWPSAARSAPTEPGRPALPGGEDGSPAEADRGAVARPIARGGGAGRSVPGACSTPTSSSTWIEEETPWPVDPVDTIAVVSPSLSPPRDAPAGRLRLRGLGPARPAHASGTGCSRPGRGPRTRWPPRPPHFPARAKHVIFLFMQGGPSHIDTFDPKPLLNRLHGQPLAAERHAGLQLQFTKIDAAILGSPQTFTQVRPSRGSRSPTPIRTCRPAPTTWPWSARATTTRSTTPRRSTC